MFLVEKISNDLALKVSSTLKLNGDEKKVIAYGAFNFFQTIWCIFMVVFFGIIFSVPLEAIIISFAVGVLRKFSGGAHSSSPNRCAVIGAIIPVGLALLLEYIHYLVNLKWVGIVGIIIFSFAYYIIYKYAPVDSRAKPIVKIETRKRMKKKSIITLNILIILFVILIISYFVLKIEYCLSIAACICLGVLWQVLTLTPKGYLVLLNIDTFFEKITKKLGEKNNEKL